MTDPKKKGKLYVPKDFYESEEFENEIRRKEAVLNRLSMAESMGSEDVWKLVKELGILLQRSGEHHIKRRNFTKAEQTLMKAKQLTEAVSSASKWEARTDWQLFRFALLQNLHTCFRYSGKEQRIYEMYRKLALVVKLESYLEKEKLAIRGIDGLFVILADFYYSDCQYEESIRHSEIVITFLKSFCNSLKLKNQIVVLKSKKFYETIYKKKQEVSAYLFHLISKARIKLGDERTGLEFMQKAYENALEVFGETSFLTQKYKMKKEDIERKINFFSKLDGSFDYNPLQGKVDPTASHYNNNRIQLKTLMTEAERGETAEPVEVKGRSPKFDIQIKSLDQKSFATFLNTTRVTMESGNNGKKDESGVSNENKPLLKRPLTANIGSSAAQNDLLSSHRKRINKVRPQSAFEGQKKTDPAATSLNSKNNESLAQYNNTSIGSHAPINPNPNYNSSFQSNIIQINNLFVFGTRPSSSVSQKSKSFHSKTTTLDSGSKPSEFTASIISTLSSKAKEKGRSKTSIINNFFHHKKISNFKGEHFPEAKNQMIDFLDISNPEKNLSPKYENLMSQRPASALPKKKSGLKSADGNPEAKEKGNDANSFSIHVTHGDEAKINVSEIASDNDEIVDFKSLVRKESKVTQTASKHSEEININVSDSGEKRALLNVKGTKDPDHNSNLNNSQIKQHGTAVNSVSGPLMRRPSLFGENKLGTKIDDSNAAKESRRPSVKLLKLSTFQILTMEKSASGTGSLKTVDIAGKNERNAYHRKKKSKNAHQNLTAVPSKKHAQNKDGIEKKFAFSKLELLPEDEEDFRKKDTPRSRISKDKHSRTSSNEDGPRRSKEVDTISNISEITLSANNPLRESFPKKDKNELITATIKIQRFYRKKQKKSIYTVLLDYRKAIGMKRSSIEARLPQSQKFVTEKKFSPVRDFFSDVFARDSDNKRSSFIELEQSVQSIDFRDEFYDREEFEPFRIFASSKRKNHFWTIEHIKMSHKKLTANSLVTLRIRMKDSLGEYFLIEHVTVEPEESSVKDSFKTIFPLVNEYFQIFLKDKGLLFFFNEFLKSDSFKNKFNGETKFCPEHEFTSVDAESFERFKQALMFILMEQIYQQRTSPGRRWCIKTEIKLPISFEANLDCQKSSIRERKQELRSLTTHVEGDLTILLQTLGYSVLPEEEQDSHPDLKRSLLKRSNSSEFGVQHKLAPRDIQGIAKNTKEKHERHDRHDRHAEKFVMKVDPKEERDIDSSEGKQPHGFQSVTSIDQNSEEGESEKEASKQNSIIYIPLAEPNQSAIKWIENLSPETYSPENRYLVQELLANSSPVGKKSFDELQKYISNFDLEDREKILQRRKQNLQHNYTLNERRISGGTRENKKQTAGKGEHDSDSHQNQSSVSENNLNVHKITPKFKGITEKKSPKALIKLQEVDDQNEGLMEASGNSENNISSRKQSNSTHNFLSMLTKPDLEKFLKIAREEEGKQAKNFKINIKTVKAQNFKERFMKKLLKKKDLDPNLIIPKYWLAGKLRPLRARALPQNFNPFLTGQLLIFGVLKLNRSILSFTVRIKTPVPFQPFLDNKTKESLFFVLRFEQIFKSPWSDEIEIEYKEFIGQFFPKHIEEKGIPEFSLESFINNEGFTPQQKKYFLSKISDKIEIVNSKVRFGEAEKTKDKKKAKFITAKPKVLVESKGKNFESIEMNSERFMVTFGEDRFKKLKNFNTVFLITKKKYYFQLPKSSFLEKATVRIDIFDYEANRIRLSIYSPLSRMKLFYFLVADELTKEILVNLLQFRSYFEQKQFLSFYFKKVKTLIGEKIQFFSPKPQKRQSVNPCLSHADLRGIHISVIADDDKNDYLKENFKKSKFVHLYKIKNIGRAYVTTYFYQPRRSKLDGYPDFNIFKFEITPFDKRVSFFKFIISDEDLLAHLSFNIKSSLSDPQKLLYNLNRFVLDKIVCEKSYLYKRLVVPVLSYHFKHKCSLDFPLQPVSFQDKAVTGFLRKKIKTYKIIFQKIIRHELGSYIIVTVKKNLIFDYWNLVFYFPKSNRSFSCLLYSTDIIKMNEEFLNQISPLSMKTVYQMLQMNSKFSYHTFCENYHFLIKNNEEIISPLVKHKRRNNLLSSIQTEEGDFVEKLVNSYII